MENDENYFALSVCYFTIVMIFSENLMNKPFDLSLGLITWLSYLCVYYSMIILSNIGLDVENVDC